jgi:hypothetical protein
MSASGAEVDKAGGNEKIHKPVKFGPSNPISIQFVCFVVDRADLQPVPDLELCDELDHLGVRFRLREHEAAKLSPGERSVLVKDHLTQIFFHRQLSFLVRVEGQVMPILHLGHLQLEVRRRPFAGMTIPPVGEQDTDIQKHAGDRSRFLYRLYVPSIVSSAP